MNITITTKNVYDYALSLTARAGALSEDYSSVALTEDNYPMLGVYLSSAVAHAEGELRRELCDSNGLDLRVTEDEVTLSLDEAVRRDLSVVPLAETSLRLFLGYYLAAEWLRPTAANALSEVYGTTGATHLQTAVNALNQRKESVVSESDYSSRSVEGSVKMASASESDYSRRAGDDVQARPGMRINDCEVLRVKSGECCCRREDAISAHAELLISNP